MTRRTLTLLAAALSAIPLALGAGAAPAIAGNGAPAGEHYTLNITGVPKAKKAPMTSSGRHTIFVPLEGSTKIGLYEGAFKVTDGNATDGYGEFQLPDPQYTEDTDTGTATTAYSVWVRALGKPGGESTMTTCFDDDKGTVDTADDETWCSTENVVIARERGGVLPFTDQSAALLTVCRNTDADADNTCDERSGLFDEENADYYWKYDNRGLKLAQLRFYPVTSTFAI